MQLSMKQKMIGLSVALATIPALAVGAISMGLAKRAIHCEIQGKLVEQSAVLKNEMDSVIGASKGQMELVMSLFIKQLHNGQNDITDVKVQDGQVSLLFGQKELRFDGLNHSLIDNAVAQMGEGYVATLFRVEDGEAVRLSTNVVKDGKRAVGTSLSYSIYDEVVNNRKTYSGKAEVLGKSYMTHYVPIINSRGRVKAIIVVGVDDEHNPAIQAIRKSIKELKVGKTGYAYVMDSKGKLIMHPKLEGKTISQYDFIKEMMEKKEGYAQYKWEGREKVVAYSYYKPYDWIVASGSYLADFEGALKDLQLIIMIVIGIAIMISVILGLLFANKLSSKLMEIVTVLSESAEQTAIASAQSSESAQMLSQGATEQAASLEETSSSLDEMNSVTKQNADNALHANKLAQQARSSAQTGNESMGEMKVAMNLMNESSDKISKIIKTIEEIAFQTNLLALNAAVEAARAGEHGKGFAVVADEVRSLAQRASNASKDTATLIEDNIAKVKDGSGILEKSGESLAEIVTSSSKVADIISEISTASKEQADGINQITNAINQMDQVTQSNAAAAEESASSSEELSAHASSLKRMIGDLEIMVYGSRQLKTESNVQSRILKTSTQVRKVALNPALAAMNNRSTKIMSPEQVIPFEDDLSAFEEAGF